LVGWSTLRDSGSHVTYAILLLAFGCMGTSVVAATGIPAEKESGTWPILLATPLDDREIALAKALGAMRRCIPAWIPLTVHLAVFSAAGLIHPVAIPLVAVIVLGNALLLAGTGVFWGAVLRRTATAAIANLLMCLGVWVILPVVSILGCGIFLVIFMASIFPPAASILFLHPAMQVGALMDGASGEHASAKPADLRFVWPYGNDRGPAKIDVLVLGAIVLAVAAVYFWVGWLFFRSAAKRVRRKVF
jgi:ABC-type transport system involved in multi-copper enzyme maturation permease subunit